MKKIIIIIAMSVIALTLTGCDLFGLNQTTTTETVVTTTIDYEHYIEINSISELQAMEMNKSYILGSDLDFVGIEWTPIGTYSEPFLGNFDGNGHIIDNLTISSDNIYNGLFGYIVGNVSDLSLTNVDIAFQTDFITYVGGLAGFATGDVENVLVSGSIDIHNSDSNSYVGMLLGFSQGRVNSEGEDNIYVPNVMDNNVVNGTIDVVSINVGYIGGLIGKSFKTNISNNESNVVLNIVGGDFPLYVGGLIGHNFAGRILIGIENLVDETPVSMEYNIVKTTISVSLNEQSVSVGGFIGYNNNGVHRNNFVETEISVDGDTLESNQVYIGGYAGENWDSEFEKIVIVSTYNNTVVGDNILIVGPAVGGDFNVNVYTNIYLSSVSNFTLNDTVTSVLSASLETSGFYETTMSWLPEFYNSIIEE